MKSHRSRIKRYIPEGKHSISTTLPSPPRTRRRDGLSIGSIKQLPRIKHCISNKNQRYSTIDDSHAFFCQYLHRKQAVIHKRPAEYQHQSFEFNKITLKHIHDYPLSIEKRPVTMKKHSPYHGLLSFIDHYFAKKSQGNVQQKIISHVLKGQYKGTQRGRKLLSSSLGQIVISSLGN